MQNLDRRSLLALLGAAPALPAHPKSAKVCPAVFANTNDPDYQLLLAGVQAGKAMLDSMTRFNMPNFTPRLAYLREMKRYGILPPDFDPAKQKWTSTTSTAATGNRSGTSPANSPRRVRIAEIFHVRFRKG